MTGTGRALTQAEYDLIRVVLHNKGATAPKIGRAIYPEAKNPTRNVIGPLGYLVSVGLLDRRARAYSVTEPGRQALAAHQNKGKE